MEKVNKIKNILNNNNCNISYILIKTTKDTDTQV